MTGAFAFDEFGPLAVHPEGGHAWTPIGRPQRLRANYHKPHGARQFFAWYSVGDDRLGGRIERRKGVAPTLRAIQAIRRLRPDGETIYVILDNLNHHRGRAARLVRGQRRRAVFHADVRVVGEPDRGGFRSAGEFAIANSDHADHPALTKAIRGYLRWRNRNTATRSCSPPSSASSAR